MTIEDERAFAQRNFCHICKKAYTVEDIRVRDHCHISRRYMGSAHVICNTRHRMDYSLPVFFHNFSAYVSKLILHGFEKYGKRLTVIPKIYKKFLCLKADQLTFLDSISFLPAPLETLVNNLLQDDDGDSFKIMKTIFGSKYKNLLRKGIHPYEYIDSFKKFNQVEFPRRRDFYSSLKNLPKQISLAQVAYKDSTYPTSASYSNPHHANHICNLCCHECVAFK